MATPRGRGSDSRSGRPRRDRPRYVPKRRVCAFCADKSKVIDFRDGAKLRRYISERAKIDSRRRTATCAKHQRQLATAIKRARILALLPYTLSHVRLTGGIGVRPFGGRPLPPLPGRFAPAPEQAPATLAQAGAPGAAPAQPQAQAQPAEQPAAQPAAQQAAEQPPTQEAPSA